MNDDKVLSLRVFMAEEPKITYKDWWLWTSLDEYSGWSYLFAKNIKANNNCFRLDNYLNWININSRSWWYIIAQLFDPVYLSAMVCFTADWYIETYWRYNEQSFINWYTILNSQWNYWPIYKSNGWYVNAIRVWNSYIWIKQWKIDKFVFWGWDWIGILTNNLIANPLLTSNSDWTIGAWWTTWANGCTHTTWVNTIVQNVITANTWWIKITFLITDWTVGKVSCFYNDQSLWKITTTRNWLYTTYIWTATWWSATFWFVPTTDFNWTIKLCDLREVTTSLEIDKATITTASKHPALLDQWDIYIGSGSSLDIVSTSDWQVTTKNIVETWYTIVSINRLWDKIIIFASDWINSKQYYWDWVSETPLETIDWAWKNITCVTVDGNRAYVLVENSFYKQLYLANGYDKQLIASNDKKYVWLSDYISYDKKAFDISWKFNMNCYNSNCMIANNNKVSIAWYNGLWRYGSDKVTEKEHWEYLYTNGLSITLTWQKIYSLWYSWNNIYIWTNEQATQWWIVYNIVRNVSNSNYMRNWYLITNPLFWDSLSSRKELSKLKIWYYNVHSSVGGINIYASCDDNFFWTMYVSWVTTTPSIWSTYQLNVNTIIWEVIKTDITGWTWTITFRTISNTLTSLYSILYNWTLTKVTWTWDTTITYNDNDNFMLVKTITSEKQWYWYEDIFSTSFINSYMPNWHKINLKIELTTNNIWVSPEIYDINILSNILS